MSDMKETAVSPPSVSAMSTPTPIHILQDVNLEIYPGELVCLLGGNASGKSTTLKTSLGIVRPASGTVDLRARKFTAALPATASGGHGGCSSETGAFLVI
ncbi:MAG: ATP-binding cassette domain-containing protein [Ardenticatenaceae bacterium]|nr:ATP-binding cassette domain-containing protein [Ardenticatenaceae bacterium]